MIALESYPPANPADIRRALCFDSCIINTSVMFRVSSLQKAGRWTSCYTPQKTTTYSAAWPAIMIWPTFLSTLLVSEPLEAALLLVGLPRKDGHVCSFRFAIFHFAFAIGRPGRAWRSALFVS